MSQSLSQIYLHIVFSTKERRPFLSDMTIRERMHIYLKGICDKQNCPSFKIGGVEDHVHIACRLSKTLAVSALIKELKQGSSIWIKQEFPGLESFHWQRYPGYRDFVAKPWAGE